MGKVLPRLGRRLQQPDRQFDVPGRIAGGDDHIVHRVDNIDIPLPEAVGPDGTLIPDDGVVIPEPGIADQEISAVGFHVIVENIEGRGNPFAVLAHERSEFIHETERLLTSIAEAHAKRMEAGSHIPQRLSLSVPGDLDRMDGMPLRPLEPEMVDGELVLVDQTHPAPFGRIAGMGAAHPLHEAENLGLHVGIREQQVQKRDVVRLLAEDIDAGPAVLEPFRQALQADGALEALLPARGRHPSPQEDEAVAAQFLVQRDFLPMAHQVGEDVADGDFRMDILFSGKVDEQHLALIILVPAAFPFPEDGLRQALSMRGDADEDVVLPVGQSGAAVPGQPEPILQPAGQDLEHQDDREGENQDENRQVGQQKAGLVEDDRGDDVIENDGMSDEHFQRSDEGDQHELDPVALRHRMVGKGEHHHVDGRAEHQKRQEAKQQQAPLVLPEQVLDEADEEIHRHAQEYHPGDHDRRRYRKLSRMHQALSVSCHKDNKKSISAYKAAFTLTYRTPCGGMMYVPFVGMSFCRQRSRTVSTSSM